MRPFKEKNIAPVIRFVRIVLCLLVMTLTGFAQGAGAVYYLTLWGNEPERVLVSVPIEAGSFFHLEFINSIYLAPVKETYIYDPLVGIVSVKVESPSAGVFEYYGLMPDGSGMATVHIKVKEIRLRSHNYQNHSITICDRRISLKGLVRDGQPLLIKVCASEDCRQ